MSFLHEFNVQGYVNGQNGKVAITDAVAIVNIILNQNGENAKKN